MVTVARLTEQLSLRVMVQGDAFRTVTGGYAGDLLSWVMARAAAGDAWVTVMGHLNAVAVASLTDAACIILAEGATLDDDARARAETEGIAVLQSDLSAFSLCAALQALLKGS